ncbi:uncharacterized protein PAC_18846 [Phialocephala subalpina]|uniref:Uncharacterized protein n=1 Tax=Phialocephala subalpina TaxID=576137 RepID=A0A1L7XVE6_9HELO|nr:uncharacterized protein PAC_18846 [Phialocephala subalpina]
MAILPKEGLGIYEHFYACIEVDGQSLLRLIFNFRSLIGAKGEDAYYSVQETIDILETIIEDARRLLVRSLILSRASTWLTVQQSENTRYGTDNGTRFSPSRLVLETEAQLKIRPKLLQMVVLLLALLNDNNLKSIRQVLEEDYELQSDRKSIEPMILKVLTLSTVEPLDFLRSTLSNVNQRRVIIPDYEETRAKELDKVLGDINTLRWLLSGSIEQLKDSKHLPKQNGSWKLTWSRYTDSDIFDQLQYSGQRETVNKIPPLKINTESLGTLLIPVEFLNGLTHNVQSKDLELINRTEPSTYDLEDQKTKQHTNVVVESVEMFGELLDAGEDLVKICHTINAYSSPVPGVPQDRSRNRLAQFGRELGRREPRPKTEPRIQFIVPKLYGSRDKRTTSILVGPARNKEVVVTSWVLEGKKILFSDMVFSVQTDLNVLNVLMKKLKDFHKIQAGRATKQSDARLKELLEGLARQLKKVDRFLAKAEEDKVQLQTTVAEKGYEPISCIDFPDHGYHTYQPPWCHYKHEYRQDSNLEIRSDRYIMSSVPEWEYQIVHFRLGDSLSTSAALLTRDTNRGKQILKGDTVLLLGSFVAVVVSKKKKVEGSRQRPCQHR